MYWRAMHTMERAFFLAAALTAAATIGCSQKQSEAQNSATAAPQGAATAAPQTVATAAQQSETAQPMAVESTTPSALPAVASIATSEGEQSGTKIDVTALKREGNTLTLRFVLSNNSSKPLVVKPWGYAGRFGNGKDFSGVHLIDAPHKKEYFAVTDTDGTCLCSNAVDDVAPGAEVAIWVKYPATPVAVSKVTVQVPHFEPMDDVPISQ